MGPRADYRRLQYRRAALRPLLLAQTHERGNRDGSDNQDDAENRKHFRQCKTGGRRTVAGMDGRRLSFSPPHGAHNPDNEKNQKAPAQEPSRANGGRDGVAGRPRLGNGGGSRQEKGNDEQDKQRGTHGMTP